MGIQTGSEAMASSPNHRESALLRKLQVTKKSPLRCNYINTEGVQKGIAYWGKQNNDMPAPNCMLKVQEEIIKVEGL